MGDRALYDRQRMQVMTDAEGKVVTVQTGVPSSADCGCCGGSDGLFYFFRECCDGVPGVWVAEEWLTTCGNLDGTPAVVKDGLDNCYAYDTSQPPLTREEVQSINGSILESPFCMLNGGCFDPRCRECPNSCCIVVWRAGGCRECTGNPSYDAICSPGGGATCCVLGSAYRLVFNSRQTTTQDDRFIQFAEYPAVCPWQRVMESTLEQSQDCTYRQCPADGQPSQEGSSSEHYFQRARDYILTDFPCAYTLSDWRNVGHDLTFDCLYGLGQLPNWCYPAPPIGCPDYPDVSNCPCPYNVRVEYRNQFYPDEIESVLEQEYSVAMDCLSGTMRYRVRREYWLWGLGPTMIQYNIPLTVIENIHEESYTITILSNDDCEGHVEACAQSRQDICGLRPSNPDQPPPFVRASEAQRQVIRVSTASLPSAEEMA